MIKVLSNIEFELHPKSAYDSIKLLAKLTKLAKPLLAGFSGKPLDAFLALDLDPDELVDLCSDIVKDVTCNKSRMDLKDPCWGGKIGIIFELCFEVLKEEYSSFLADMGLTWAENPDKETDDQKES